MSQLASLIYAIPSGLLAGNYAAWAAVDLALPVPLLLGVAAASLAGLAVYATVRGDL